MRIDVWSDLVCPWCYIGFKRLDRVIAASGVECEVYHHAYQLNQNWTGPTRPTVEVLAENYGIDVEDARALMLDVTDAAKSEGLEYRLDETLTGNTGLAHRFLMYAAEKGKSHEVLMSLFKAYFEDAKSIFEISDLEEHALANGLDWQDCKAQLVEGAYADVLRYDRELAEQLNVHGTPHFFFNQKYSVSGADTFNTMLETLRLAAADSN